MNSLNSVLLEGNLVKDPDYKVTTKGTSVCNFSIACNKYFKNDEGEYVEKVDFFDIEVWSGLADNCNQYLFKGRGVRVVGRLKQDKWINKDGDTKYKIKVVGEHVEFKPHFTKKSA